MTPLCTSAGHPRASMTFRPDPDRTVPAGWNSVGISASRIQLTRSVVRNPAAGGPHDHQHQEEVMYPRNSSLGRVRRRRPDASAVVTDGRRRLAPVAAAVLVSVLAAMAGTAHAQSGCYARGGQLYCGNDAPTPIYAQASFGREDARGGFRPTPVVDTLKTDPSSFKCWVHGDEHPGRNDIWYYTNGDVTGRWGYVPAVKVHTTTD